VKARGGVFTVDCSVSMAWLFDEQSDIYTEAALDALSQGHAVAPQWWPIETINVLLVLERRNRLSSLQATQLLRHLHCLPVELKATQSSPIELHALAHQNKLSSYDALYLDIALNARLPIATRDKRLRQAAIDCGVGVWEPKIHIN
jgi:predicted nucleic acid-binding protein